MIGIPSKWCIRQDAAQEVCDWFKKYRSTYNARLTGNFEYLCYDSEINKTEYCDTTSRYEEITLDQFKKYVLKQDTMNTQDKIKQLEVELNKLKEEVKKDKYPEYYKFAGINGRAKDWTIGKIYKCAYPESLTHIFNFIDDRGEKNGWGEDNYKYFTPSTKEEFDKQEELSIGDYIVFENLKGSYSESNGDIVKITCIADSPLWVTHKPDSFSGGGFSYNAYKDNIRKATKEEIAKATNKTKELYFGDTKVTIKQGSSYAETQYGNISKVEIKEIIDFFNQDITLLGRKMSIKNSSTWYISFGCQQGTLAQIKEIYKAFD
jgi:hypothetical protein